MTPLSSARRPGPNSSEARAGTPPDEPRGLVVLGATGSIGTQTLEVASRFPERFEVRALTAGTNADLLARMARRHRPECVVIGDARKAGLLRRKLRGLGTRVLTGEAGLCEAAMLEGAGTVVAAVVGFAGLAPVLAALEAGKTVALANKETLVAGGGLVAQCLEAGDGRLLPVDSEHSALFQCLVGEHLEAVERLILTASGGPFRDRPAETFDTITPDEALDHPNWEMGAKITIDSATMMNKGLEVIEAHWLFGLPSEALRVIVHPQSVVHSMVAFRDGTVKAQLGVPDMKGPIQYALSYPARWPAPHERLSFTEMQQLDFGPPDLEKFPCLRLAFEALEAGGTAPAVLNAANEAAVQLFLEEKIRFTGIPHCVEDTLGALAGAQASSLEMLQALDREAREHVHTIAPAQTGG